VSVAWAVLRPLIFIPGFSFGMVFGVNAALFGGGGGPMMLRVASVLVPLLLCLGAPASWVLSAKTEAGDQWTMGYVVSWLVFIGTTVTLVKIF
jgi:hypothetical protein